MNDPELNLNSPSDLAGQVAALQRQVFTLLLALIVVSGTLVAYLGYESHHLRKDIAASTPRSFSLTNKNCRPLKVL